MIKKAAVPLLFCLLVSSPLFGCGQKEEEQQAEPGTVEEAAGEETPEGSDDENGGFVIDLKDGSISSTEEETVERCSHPRTVRPVAQDTVESDRTVERHVSDN